jgi:hypothetical protein
VDDLPEWRMWCVAVKHPDGRRVFKVFESDASAAGHAHEMREAGLTVYKWEL